MADTENPTEIKEPASAQEANALPELRVHVPGDVRNPSFPVGVRGYDRRAVDVYVHRVNQVIAELEVSRSPQAAVRHAVERVTEQTRHVLEEARESAEKITASARAEAEEIMAAAKAEAATLVVNSSTEADRLKAEGEQTLAQAQADANAIVARAREEGEKIVAEARSQAAELQRQTEEEISRRREEAEAHLREVQTDTDSVLNERRRLLGDIEGIAARLHEAAAEAAGRFSSETRAESAEEAREEPVAPAGGENS